MLDQAGHAAALGGGDGPGIADPELVELRADQVLTQVIDLVDDQRQRLAGAAQFGGDVDVGGADAVVGVDLDYEVVGQSMLMVSASGTAVVIE